MDDQFQRPTFGSAVLYKDPVAALDWLQKAFGFERTMVITDATGKLVHSEMRFGDGYIMVGGEFADFVASPASVGGKTHSLSTSTLRTDSTPTARGRGGRRGDRARTRRSVLRRPGLFSQRSGGSCLELRPDRAAGVARGSGEGQRPEDRRLGLSTDRRRGLSGHPAIHYFMTIDLRSWS